MVEPRAYTADELRDKLLNHFLDIAHYWADLPEGEGSRTTYDRIEGAIFSVLSTLDGCSPAMCGIDLVLRPHEDDKQFCIDEGENWIEDGTVISDMLHEHFCRLKNSRG